MISDNLPIDESDPIEGSMKKYSFPFKPYEIQKDLIDAAYEALDDGRFALLESPTGTGKSMSLLCSSITWLLDYRAKQIQSLEIKKEDITSLISQLKEEEEISGDWLTNQAKTQDLNKQLADVEFELELATKFDKRASVRWLAKIHDIGSTDCESTPFKKKPTVEESKILQNDESIVIEDDEGEDIEKKIKENSEEEHVTPKIYYASRTHSQLSQFIREIKKTKFADTNKGPSIRLTPIASRANTCVNPDVIKLKYPNAINERCTELQRETKKENRCPYANAKQVYNLKEHILSSVQDIEDIVFKGKSMGSCPYYATRMAVAEADVVVLPYNNLLHHETRKASSLDLKGSIVIIDEAHNILETICTIHSASINMQQLIASHTILSRYYAKFHNRMAPRNADMVKSIVQCVTAIVRYLDDPSNHLMSYENPKSVQLDESISESPNCNKTMQKQDNSKMASQKGLMIDVRTFIGAANIERFNIFKIIDFFNRSQLARKLIGFYRQDQTIDLLLETNGLPKRNAEENMTPKENPKKKRKVGNKEQPVNVSPAMRYTTCAEYLGKDDTNLNFLTKRNKMQRKDLIINSYPIYTLVEFLRSLTNLSHDGKVLTSVKCVDFLQSTLKFVLLNPASQFKQMAQEARSIILAGGTMQPFSEYSDLLFKPLNIEPEKIKLFSCGHVVSKDQLFVGTVTGDSKGRPLELSYKTKDSIDMIDDYGRVLHSTASVVPGGVVCFFASYEYEQKCFKRWTSTGVFADKSFKKKVFREPTQTKDTQVVLDAYTKVIEETLGEPEKNAGAMLFCVVGGKMSEGINFNDHLARCVVMIGVPYANITSCELQQKMSYYDKTCATPKAGQQYYENLCIRGINQSIGRAIRHANDYAAILLLDRRYATSSPIKNGLPEWIRQSVVEFGHTGACLARLREFYWNANSLKAQKELPERKKF